MNKGHLGILGVGLNVDQAGQAFVFGTHLMVEADSRTLEDDFPLGEFVGKRVLHKLSDGIDSLDLVEACQT